VAGGVPARVFVPDERPGGGAPGVLLFGHGGGHSKDSPRFVSLAGHYADATGHVVVSIDAVDHGERRPPGLPRGAGSGPPARWHSNNAERMVADWRAAAEAAGAEGYGPAIAYVGFSMGAVFGYPVVAAMRSIGRAVFVVGGIPSGGGIDDPPLEGLLLDAAGRLGHADVLLLNKRDDTIFDPDGAHVLFDGIRARTKQLRFSPGDHDDWPPSLIDESVAFLRSVPN
jgi:dienelactone hydrolase